MTDDYYVAKAVLADIKNMIAIAPISVNVTIFI